MEINYIYEINRFHRYLSTHSLSTSSQLLWFKLMDLFNSQKWSEEWISLSNQRLMYILQTTSEKTAIRARNGLIDAKLIYYIPGTKSSPGKYKMNYFCSMDSGEGNSEDHDMHQEEWDFNADDFPADNMEENRQYNNENKNTVENIVEDIQCKNYSVNNTDNQENTVINTVKSTDNQKYPVGNTVKNAVNNEKAVTNTVIYPVTNTVGNTVKSTDNIKNKKQNIDINIYNTSTSSLCENNDNNHEKENESGYINNPEEKKVMDVINSLDRPKEFKIALVQFVIYRGRTGSPICTEYCLKLILQDLEKLAPHDDNMQIKILNQSIKNGWKKLVEVPETENEISSVSEMKLDIVKEYEQHKKNMNRVISQMTEEEEKGNE